MKKQLGVSVWIGACVSALLVGLAAPSSDAVPIMLSDGNSTAEIDPGTGNIISWVVDGVDQIGAEGVGHQYRIGGGVDESPIGSVTMIGSNVVNGNILVLNYLDTVGTSDFTADLFYTLTGGAAGSGFSSLDVSNTITLVSAGPLDFHLFELADLDLSGTAAGDSATISVAPSPTYLVSAMQSDSQSTYQQLVTAGSASLQPPSGYEVGEASALAAKFTDGLETNLGTIGAAATSDAAFALQYDFTLSSGGPSASSFVLELSTLNSNVVPEPASAGLALAGLTAIGLATRRRKSSGVHSKEAGSARMG